MIIKKSDVLYWFVLICMLLSAKKYGIEEVNPTVINLISHATQEKLREFASKLSVAAEHRVEIYKVFVFL